MWQVAFIVFVELFETPSANLATPVTSSHAASRPLLTSADTKATPSLSSSLVSPSLKLGDDSHVTHLVPRLAPPSTLSMCMFFCGFIVAVVVDN